MEEKKIPPPIIIEDSQSVATHLSYVRRDLDQYNINQKQGFHDMNGRIDSLDEKLDRMAEGFVSQSQFSDHLKVDNDHENRIRELEKFSRECIEAQKSIDSLARKDEVELLKKIVYGAVGIILIAFAAQFIVFK